MQDQETQNQDQIGTVGEKQEGNEGPGDSESGSNRNSRRNRSEILNQEIQNQDQNQSSWRNRKERQVQETQNQDKIGTTGETGAKY